ncbi:NAD(P)-binding domain-containing protein [Hoyosella sp. YIM 151337]|uniref:NAD(P)-dependent oxidoreductase n=1 Tax=Hoyosella sp. YIM 151337 TaxID=2992742 RepID=UPI00223548F5|nr:NAD(P)-binding domain-containing protein [Hoyosella sp. YIM 151337]MCW4352392.1 NAD(P)-binding domain-containing protein [Hoyosella sp. YIM 151337]
MPSSAPSVTVIGLGPMGQAITRALLRAGTAVTVWNRTPSKADAMVALGAKRAETVAEALEANDVALLSLTHYEAMYDVLSQAPNVLNGRTIVNLTSDSPQNTRAGAQWVRDHGSSYLTGAFMSQGDDITHPLSYVFYSGPEKIFRALRDVLTPLSPPEYLGPDYGLAQLYYQGLLTIFHPFVLSYEQALATIEQSGGEIDRFTPYARRFMDSIKDFMVYFTDAAKQGGWGDIASLRMMHAGAQHVIDTSNDAGIAAPLTRTVQEVYARAIEASTEARPVRTYELIQERRPSPREAMK